MSQPEMEYRCIRQEWLDGSWYVFAGKAGAFEQADADVQEWRATNRCRHVAVEARVKSSEPWPAPWDYDPFRVEPA